MFERILISWRHRTVHVNKYMEGNVYTMICVFMRRLQEVVLHFVLLQVLLERYPRFVYRHRIQLSL